MVWGGGRLANSLGVSYETVFEKFQLYRLLTYGYVQTAVWHLLANGFAFWSVGRYLEKRICTGLLLLVYHTSLAAAGAFIFCFIQTASIRCFTGYIFLLRPSDALACS